MHVNPLWTDYSIGVTTTVVLLSVTAVRTAFSLVMMNACTFVVVLQTMTMMSVMIMVAVALSVR